MILGENPRAVGTAATPDDLFRRAGVRHPESLALADPPNRQGFTTGVPRTLSFAQTDRAISASRQDYAAWGCKPTAPWRSSFRTPWKAPSLSLACSGRV